MTTRQTSINQFSVMRILGCVSIVLLHSLFASKVYFVNEMSSWDSAFELYAEHLLMWGVPLFLMITGALLLDSSRELPLNKLLFKYVRRILIALIIFTFLFQSLEFFMEGAGEKEGIVKFILIGGLENLIFAKSWAHLWYLYMIIGLYLWMPMFKGFVSGCKTGDEKNIRYLIIIMLIFTSIVPSLNKIFGNVGFGIPVETVYPLYLFLGYYLFNFRPKMITGITLFLVTTVCIILVTPHQMGGGSGVDFFKSLTEYSSVLIVGQTAGIFIIFNSISIKFSSIVHAVDDCTFGIYLMHMIGIRLIMKWSGINPYEYGWWFFFAIAVVLFIVFGAFTYIIKSIPKMDFL